MPKRYPKNKRIPYKNDYRSSNSTQSLNKDMNFPTTTYNSTKGSQSQYRPGNKYTQFPNSTFNRRDDNTRKPPSQHIIFDQQGNAEPHYATPIQVVHPGVHTPTYTRTNQMPASVNNQTNQMPASMDISNSQCAVVKSVETERTQNAICGKAIHHAC